MRYAGRAITNSKNMTTASVLTTAKRKTERVRKPRTKEAFLTWDQPAGQYMYEWVDEELKKINYIIKNTERGIVQRAQRAFTKM